MSKTQNITLSLDDGRDLSFEIGQSQYAKLINGMMKNPFNSQHNFLVESVTEEARPVLTELLENPANVVELCSSVMEEYAPTVQVVAKKRKN